MKLNFIKTPGGLSPCDQDAEKWLIKVRAGGVVSGEFRRTNNPKFHRKLMALLRLGFDNWDAPSSPVSVGGSEVVPGKNFDRFRGDVMILAGYYETFYRLDGTYRVEPRSLSFSAMDNDQRERVYSKIVDVLLENVYGGELTREEVDTIVDKYLGFM